jgi:7,8-dihydropterin-6-yl-methyl-4-(beta-D-ribofuranosyl)aminobenzene 5'-phosphate synthase
MLQVDSVSVSVVVDNTTDMLSTRPPHVASELRVLMAAGMRELTGEGLCSAHHGLSLLVTARVGEQERTVLFDAGPDPYGLERNARRMGLNFGKIEGVILSHGHFDHSEGLLKAIELVRERNPQQSVPLHLHPGVFVRRAVRLPNGEMIPLQEVPSASALSGHGYVLVESNQQEEFLDGAFFLSGEIPRKSFERGMANQVRLTPSGDWEPDPLVLDERFMIAHIRGKGLALFTGCSHAGIVNICSHARDLFPETPLYALVGGLHLVYPNEDLVEPTIAELKKFNFSVIVPGHCTGWRAVHALVRAFGEDRVDPLAVGTRQSL